jgi:hypothetical protein
LCWPQPSPSTSASAGRSPASRRGSCRRCPCGAGHLLLKERPEDCVAAIERFLAEGSTSALAPAGSVVSGRRV